MQLLSKRFIVKRAKGRQLLDLLEDSLSKSLSPNDTKLRYFIVSAGKKTISVEMTYFKE